VKRLKIDHKLLIYPQRLYVFDAVYLWRLNEQIKQEVFAEQDKALQVLRLETGFSRKRCLEILRGTKQLDDFAVRPGYNVERRNVNELQ
jgi:hypothetical protein